MPVSFTQEEAYAFLDSKPGFLILTTIGRKGFPHSVPVGYFRVDDCVYVGGRSKTQRIKNVQRNAKVSALLEKSGSRREDLQGLMLQGEADIIEEPDQVLWLLREAARQRGTPESDLPTESRAGASYLRIKPTHSISWDYSRGDFPASRIIGH